MRSERNYIKIVIGALLILVQIANFPLYFKSTRNQQSDAALIFTFFAFLGGIYLLYTGLYPRKKL
jgi:predicted negative regulator of RcsB-dependent stress response